MFGPAGIPRVDTQAHPQLTITMKEVEQQVLPDPNQTPYPGGTCPAVNVQKTRVWAYETADKNGRILGPARWPAVTLDIRRHTPTVVKYQNELPQFNPSNLVGNIFSDGLVQGVLTVDQTIHWADPNGVMLQCMAAMVDCTKAENSDSPCCKPFTGAPPSVPHLHGAEVPSQFDGGPDAWFTQDGKKGPAYATLYNAGDGTAVYAYPNSQEPGTLWFHDHSLGATRTNVYSGLEAFYLVRDPANEPKNLPSGPFEIEMVFQDRQFDTNSQLFFPDGSGADVATSNLNGPPTNPDLHPFWIPEFIGDVAVVNGAPWPYLKVEPRRYRLRLLNGANARVFRLSFGTAPVFQIGADDNYLDAPVPVQQVFIAPGERADVIVDFSRLAREEIVVTNNAPVPYPDGLIPGVDQPGMASVMMFKVQSRQGRDNSCNPAAGECRRPNPVLRLTDGKGNLARGVKIDKVRQLILKEHESPGGPVEVLLNNTRWDGTRSPNIAPFFADGITETPRIGSTEMWEIINLTGDAHPIHTHLVQFEILNRQSFDADGTITGVGNGYIGLDTGNPATTIPGAWAKAFGSPLPLQCDGLDPLNPCPAYGPPLPYVIAGETVDLPNGQKKVPVVGGNPDITPYLINDAAPPSPEESGLKDTGKANPGQVMRIVMRWAPTSAPLIPGRSLAGINLYPFDPTTGPGYVWHCHILDHEDNEMMRPYKVRK
ncbi:multicopper oxidase family protein [Geomesophilobacter sediminis]|uniref:multicopper oxidase family protein n=1 Tax=Geomesophilobacter sediminis TaxID=2798584 RepID=UPI002E2AA689|nr:multicopper oxidase [Geomesophilobacter sediminis]